MVEIGLHPFTAAFVDTNGVTSGERIDCGAASLQIGSGHIGLTLKQWLNNQLAFAGHWMACLARILCPGGHTDHRPAVLLFGVGEDSLFVDGNDARFVAFCRRGPIEPLRSGRRFIVHSIKGGDSSQPADFVYCRHPLLVLLSAAKLGPAARLRLAVSHLWLSLTYTVGCVLRPALSLLARDFAYARAVYALDEHGLIDAVVVTCAVAQSQPLWQRVLKRAQVHMVWYAQNWKPIRYKSAELGSSVPSLRRINADKQWVWTDSFARYLHSLGHTKKIETVGPIVWYLPEKHSLSNTKLDITIFDVSPYSDEIAISYGELPNYNRPNHLFSFLEDIIALKPALEKLFCQPVRLHLKTKRGFNPAYCKEYFSFLDQLDSLRVLYLEHHTTNLYALISRSHLVIAYPFTSPAYIAEHLKVPAIYYDPTASILPDHFGDSSSLIIFANTRQALFDAARTAIDGRITDKTFSASAN